MQPLSAWKAEIVARMIDDARHVLRISSLNQSLSSQ
jgi:hypothetical protein